MELRTRDGQLKLGSAYRMIATGWFLGFGALYGALFLLILLIAVLSGDTSGLTFNGEPAESRSAVIGFMLMMLVLFPIVLFVHALFFGGVIVLGLLIYRKFRPIRILSDDEMRRMLSGN